MIIKQKEVQTKMQEQTNNWRDSISQPKETLKLADKEVATFTFRDIGLLNPNAEYGNSILFLVGDIQFLIKKDINEPVKVEGDLNWYVNAKNYDLLGQIKELGEIKGLKVCLKRTGTKRTDTRYTIEKVD